MQESNLNNFITFVTHLCSNIFNKLRLLKCLTQLLRLFYYIISDVLVNNVQVFTFTNIVGLQTYKTASLFRSRKALGSSSYGHQYTSWAISEKNTT